MQGEIIASENAQIKEKASAEDGVQNNARPQVTIQTSERRKTHAQLSIPQHGFAECGLALFDLDDTLIPTDWLRREYSDTLAHIQFYYTSDSGIAPNNLPSVRSLLGGNARRTAAEHILRYKLEQDHASLDKLAASLICHTIHTYGFVAIVTNARSASWLETVQRVFPTFSTALRQYGVPVIRATESAERPDTFPTEDSYHRFWTRLKEIQFERVARIVTQLRDDLDQQLFTARSDSYAAYIRRNGSLPSSNECSGANSIFAGGWGRKWLAEQLEMDKLLSTSTTLSSNDTLLRRAFLSQAQRYLAHRYGALQGTDTLPANLRQFCVLTDLISRPYDQLDKLHLLCKGQNDRLTRTTTVYNSGSPVATLENVQSSEKIVSAMHRIPTKGSSKQNGRTDSDVEMLTSVASTRSTASSIEDDPAFDIPPPCESTAGCSLVEADHIFLNDTRNSEQYNITLQLSADRAACSTADIKSHVACRDCEMPTTEKLSEPTASPAVLPLYSSRPKFAVEPPRPLFPTNSLDLLSVGDSEFELVAARSLAQRCSGYISSLALVKCAAGLRPDKFKDQLQELFQATELAATIREEIRATRSSQSLWDGDAAAPSPRETSLHRFETVLVEMTSSNTGYQTNLVGLPFRERQTLFSAAHQKTSHLLRRAFRHFSTHTLANKTNLVP